MTDPHEEEAPPMLPDAVCAPLVAAYLASGMYDPQTPPKRCDPATVAQVVLEEAGARASGSRHERARVLVALYALTGVADAYGRFLRVGLDDPERRPETRSAMALARTAGVHGGPEARAAARAYAETVLLAEPDAPQMAAGLLELLADLGPGAPIEAFAARLAHWRAAAAARAGASYAAHLDAQALAFIAEDSLPRARARVAEQARIESLLGPALIDALVASYAYIGPPEALVLSEWAGGQLLALAAQGGDAREAVAASLRRALSAPREGDSEGARFTRDALLEALAFVSPRAVTANERGEIAKARADGRAPFISTVQPAGAPDVEPR